MQIDDYAAAAALSARLEATAPFKARPGKELIKLLQQKGVKISPTDELEITSVTYSGDMGGIMCGVSPDFLDKEAIVTSITHLKFDPSHPLADDVKVYQQQRIRGLKIQDGRSFMAEIGRLQQSSTPQKKQRKGGFGK